MPVAGSHAVGTGIAATDDDHLLAPGVDRVGFAATELFVLWNQQFQRGMDALMKGRTSFVIAHRLSTIRRADRILVIENGHIAEQGSHAELLKLRGHYYRLYTQQFRH